ncbi:MAG: UDP-N-acetylglucosamine 2-epimerase (non-hydrolyzing) [Deltaproteobacteria bacterium]|nr:UDP-N-acetylglucosamine 2-epimerase (non-hydrolyzing) [Deltaproteobacteria bacterium]
MKALLVAGARPNFMKIAPVYRAAQVYDSLECLIVHTGQHYDYAMSQTFFDDLELPEPDHFLEAGSGSHAEQTARVMVAFEEVCLAEKPDLVIVVGDVNSTLACSIVAKKLLIKVAHIEAGLRSFDLTMPEEINRMVTDAISDYFFVTEASGAANLLREGKPGAAVFLVGHVMIDNLLHQAEKLKSSDTSAFAVAALKRLHPDYFFMTMHRPANVDDPETLQGIVGCLNEIAKDYPIFFPVHPRTAKMLEQFAIELSDNIHCLGPLGFRESLYLWQDAIAVLTDSGGLQEETTALGVPCLTLRENTERPITIELGTNILVGNQPEGIMKAYEELRKSFPVGDAVVKRSVCRVPQWDGRAAERIWKVLLG